MSSPVHVYLPGLNDRVIDELTRVLPGRRFLPLDNNRAFVLALPRIELLLTGGPPCNRWAAAENLRLIQVAGSGVDTLLPAPDLPEHVVICSSRGSHDPHLPEFVMAMLLGLAYNIPQLVRQQQLHQWKETFPRPLYDQTLCVLGPGDDRDGGCTTGGGDGNAGRRCEPQWATGRGGRAGRVGGRAALCALRCRRNGGLSATDR